MSGLDGPVKSIKVIDDQLIVAGWFTYADTVLANGLARWDGSAWHRVVDVPAFYIGGGPNQINDVELFQGTWYIGGNLPLVDDIARWNGTAWEEVGNGMVGGISQVNRLIAHDDKLHVAGSFSRCPPSGSSSNPGSGIVTWDGSAWDDLGGGTCGSINGTVISMVWWQNELHACGNFDRMGGQPGDRLAKWDGDQWCMLTPPGFWGNGGPNALAVHHDSLYIGGAFVEAGGEPASCFGKWTGGDYTYACGTTGMHEAALTEASFGIFPNPAQGPVTFTTTNASEVRVMDALGRTVWSGRIPGTTTIDASNWAAGTYSVQHENGMVRLVVIR